MHKYLVIFEKANGNYSAYSPDIPGCIATGKTREDAERSIKEAISFHIEGLKEDGLPVPERTPGGHRLYSRRDIETVKWLLEQRKAGLGISKAVALWKQLETNGNLESDIPSGREAQPTADFHETDIVAGKRVTR